MRTVFFGTPEIAVPTLDSLHRIAEVVGVVCQPDRPAGRGLQLQPPPVKRWAISHGISVFQPEKVRNGELRDWLRDCDVDVAVVLAYGRILPPDVLATPRRGCLNLHASLLPRHRGAAPIQWALIEGDAVTGISLMQMDEGLDTGPVYTRHEIAVDDNDDTGTLSEKLAKLAANVVESDLVQVVEGKLTPTAQDSSAVTYAPPLRHEDQWVDFTKSSDKIIGHIKGLSPKPGAFAKLRGRRLKLIQVGKCDELVDGPPGTVRLSRRSICVATGDGSLELLRVQPEGKGIQNASDYINGRGIASGDRFE